MKATRFYLTVVAPFAAWVSAEWLLSKWQAGLDVNRMLPLGARVLVSLHLLLVRWMPWAVVGAVVLGPLVTLVAAWRVLPSREGKPRILEAVPWLVLGVASWTIAFVLTATGAEPGAVIVLFWSAATADAVYLALSYRVQRQLHADGQSRISGAVLLVASIISQVTWRWASLAAAAIPAWVELGARDRGAVEQGDEADEAR
jgi:hypothetical protein